MPLDRTRTDDGSPFSFEMSSDRAPLGPWRGKRIIVHVVVNVEYWPIDTPMPRKLLGAPHGRQHVPDVPNYSWVQYGLRCGLPRLAETLLTRGIPASASVNSAIAEHYPSVTRLMLDAGWEWIAHGVQQQSLPDTDDERQVIVSALDQIEAATGTRPRGWLGPGLHETLATPSILSDEGIDYVSDWGLDDRPTWLAARPRPLVSLPYTLELNDSVLFAAQWNTVEEYVSRIVETLEVFEMESQTSTTILTLGLHPHLIGVPHRIRALGKVLDRLAESSHVGFATGSQICDWFASESAPPNDTTRTESP